MKEREQWKKYLLLRKNTIFGKNSASEKCFKVDFFFMEGLMIGKPCGIYEF